MNRFLTIVLFIMSITSYGQTHFVRGTIYDETTKESIIGVSVYEMDKNGRIISGTASDATGNYSFQASSPNATIIFSFIGYDTRKIPLNGSTEMNVYLSSATLQMDEVVIKAKAIITDEITGVSQRDMSSSFSTLDMKMAETTSSNISVDDALQGNLTGVDVVGGGAPGSGSSIIIRGVGSLGSSKPLIVIDGIPQDLDVANFDFSVADQEDIGDLVGVAFQDIDNISVLKDASATAVWGSKGANGVILINTKKGQTGRTRYMFQSKFSMDQEPSPIPMLNGDEYSIMQLEQLHAVSGITELPIELSYDKQVLGKDYYNYTVNTDWVNAILRTGFTQDYFFKVGGGGDKARYYASVGYVDEIGTTKNTGSDRLSTRVNVDYNISKQLLFSIQLSYSNIHKDDNFWGSGVRSMANLRSPNMSIYKYDIDGNNTGEFFNPISSYQSPNASKNYFNPVAATVFSQNDVNENKTQSTFNINYKPADWLIIKEVFSYTYVISDKRSFLPEQAIGVDLKDQYNNRNTEGNNMSQRLYSRTQLLMTPNIGVVHQLVGALNWEVTSDKGQGFVVSTSNTVSSYFDDPGAGGTVVSASSSKTASRLLGGLASLNYVYQDRYGISINIKAEGLAALSSASRWGMFPSFSGFWRFSNEPFARNLNWLNDSKFRLSYGASGSTGGIGVYTRYASYSGGNRQYWENNVVEPKNVQLDNLKFQTTYQGNAGVNLSLFDNRLDFVFDFYKKTTKDLLVPNYPIPSSSGFDKLIAYNSGIMVNKGWEIYLNMRVIEMEDLRISMGFNVSNNRNSFDEFPGNISSEQGVDLGKSTFPVKFIEGQPIGSVYGLQYNGVYSTDADTYLRDVDGQILYDFENNPLKMRYKNTYEFQAGDARYVDINNDGNIDVNDAVYLGNGNPEFEGGLNFFLNYKKNLTFSCNFHTRLGFDVVNLAAISLQSMDNKDNQSKAVLNRWRKPGDYGDKMLPRAYMGNSTNGLGSDLYVEDASFLRLKSISLDYKLPKKIAQSLRVEAMNISLSARNIYTWTNYTGVDPEVRFSNNDASQYLRDNSKIPPTSRYTLGLSVNF